MNRILAACASVAFLGTSVVAQTHLITPKSGTEVEGNEFSFIFGWAADVKQRFMDFSQVGPARTIKGLSFRLDGRNHDAIGRTWSNVKIYMGHADWSSVQYNKSAAYKMVDTPVKVFDQQWSFPTLKGKPVLDPAAWGGLRNSLSFRLSTPFKYNGKDALFFEFQFSGGKAADNRPWNGQTPKGFEYYLDSMSERSWRGQNGNRSYPAKPKPCYDSAFFQPASLKVSVTGKSNITLDIQSYYTADKGPVIHTLGVAGNAKGLDVGAECNLFYPDLFAPLVLLLLPPPNNRVGYAQTKLTAAKQPWMKDFWVQVIWLDSRTGNLKLTHAVQAAVDGSQPIPYATSYQTGGKFNVWTSTKGLPYVRYQL